MSAANPSQSKQIPSLLRSIISVVFTLLVIGVLFLGVILVMSPAGQTLAQNLNWLFAANTVQLWWYVTRAAGIIAYLLLWFSMVLGLAVTSKYLDQLLDRMFTYDFHQFISQLSIAFVLLHIVVLSLDRYLPYTAAQILIPFLSPYRPVWVGIGVIAFYVTLLVTITFYLRSRIGMRAFRAIHVFSLLGYLGATLHGLYAGTDAVLPAMQLVYQGTSLTVLFLTVFWLVLAALRKRTAQRQTAPISVGRQKSQAGMRSSMIK
jgi:predicted ferric reductase